ncbi:triacylglycerol lipase [Nocardiopsis sp. FR26]|uniref:esterase/lipase family protein n=1 Tax=Nocardiopsis sp. FR26 TaxID=2605987 RepID=UPI001915286E|nr:hypothetical protein [Nocardiopsis sp. FR26]
MKRTNALAAFLTLLLVAPPGGLAHAQGGSAFGPTSNPVLLVHGCSSDGSVWNTMAARFGADGWPTTHLDQWSYDYRQSNAITARQLSQEVDRLLGQTAASRVAVVSHSMGGLSSRYYARNPRRRRPDRCVGLPGRPRPRHHRGELLSRHLLHGDAARIGFPHRPELR